MYAARICQGLARSGGASASRKSLLLAPPSQANLRATLLRSYAQDARSGFARHAERRRAGAAIKEAASAPTKGTPFALGQGAVAGGAAVGLGALCFYGMGLSDQPGAVDRQHLWPDYVRRRIRDTYAYFGASVGVTAATAAAVFRTPALMRFASRQGWVALGVSVAALIGSGMVARSIPYEEGLGAKQLAWLTHCAVLGFCVAPIASLGGQILVRAAWYTAGMVGGLSTGKRNSSIVPIISLDFLFLSIVAVCAPSDKFLNMGGALALGLGAVFAASLGTYFLPASTALGAGVHSVALYGGLLLFGAFLLYDTQKIIRNAESHPERGAAVRRYDPINNSIGIYLDTVNIFIRVAQMLAMGGGGKRK